jgi:hypothetical protein
MQRCKYPLLMHASPMCFGRTPLGFLKKSIRAHSETKQFMSSGAAMTHRDGVRSMQKQMMNTVLLQRVMANRLCLGQNLVRGLVKISI